MGFKYNGIFTYKRAAEGDLRPKRRRRCDHEVGFEDACLEDWDERLEAKEGIGLL